MTFATSPLIVFLQSNPSQLDDSFYSNLAKINDRFLVLLLNSGDIARTEVDPELGFTPIFPDPALNYRTVSIASEQNGGITHAIRRIRQLRPQYVVIQDQTWRAKLRLIVACTICRIKPIVRSDKNYISNTSRAGIWKKVEGLMFRALVQRLAPVSPLTSSYYGWKKIGNLWSFPYPSSAAKFARGDEAALVRKQVRKRFSIPSDATVFLVVAKLVERENAGAAIEAFARTHAKHHNTTLLVIGDGRQRQALHDRARALGLGKSVQFLGYVPYHELQCYFWASDVLVHLARCEPWGASAQDALVAQMGLVASTRVGAAVCHLGGPLTRFIVPPDDLDAAAHAMSEFAASNGDVNEFRSAWRVVANAYTAEALAAQWGKRMAPL